MKFRYMGLFFGYLKKNLKSLLLMLSLVGLNQICYLYIPALMSDLIDVGIRGQGDIISSQTAYILKVGALMLLVTLVSIFITIAVNRIMAKISSDISYSIRKDLFRKIMNLPYAEASRFSASSLMTRLTSDTQQVQSLIMTSTQLVLPPMMLFGGVFMSIRVCPSLTWIIILGGIIAGLIVFSCLSMIASKSKIMQETEDEFNLTVNERLGGIFITRCFGNSLFEQERFRKVNSKFANISFFISRITAIMSPILTLCANLLSVLVIWTSSLRVAQSEMNVGEVVAFMQYTFMIVGAFIMISMMVSMIPRSLVSIKRVGEILSFEEKPKVNLKLLSGDFDGEIEFRNVGFKYPEAAEKALEDISFGVKSGEKIGIIGSVGSGKSTLLKLILGFYDSFDGEILFGGESIRNLEKNSILDAISYVSQNDSLFSGTVSSNLRFGREEISDDELRQVLEIVNLSDLASSEGLSKEVLQQGKNFSGGQRQRLTIARALLRDSKVFIFDDVFSNLDFKTEAQVRNKILKKLEEKTVILVSQRVGTIKNADKIIVLDSGRIIAVGNHESLIKNCELYRKMIRLQVGGEETLEK